MLPRVTVIDAMALFGATGRLGPLRCSAALADIAAVLGPPMDGGRVSKRRRWPHRFLYESVELVVCRCRLVERIGVPTWHDDCRIPGPQPGQWLSELQGMTFQRLTLLSTRPAAPGNAHTGPPTRSPCPPTRAM